MAQVNAQYPDLSQMFGQYSLNPLEYGMQRFESAQAADKTNQQQALQDMLFQQQNDPLKLEASRLANRGTEAGLPGIFADTSLKQDKAAVSRGSLGEQIGAAVSKGKADISDNDLKIIENSAQKMAMSRDENERNLGVALLKQHKDIIRDREKQDAQQVRQLAQIKEQGNQARLTQQQAIDAGKFVKGVGGGSGGGSIQDQLASGKLSYEKAATLLAGAAFMAEQEGDIEKANSYRQMADQYNQQHVQSKQAGAFAGQVGKPDVGALGGIPTVQQKPVLPFSPVVPKQAPAVEAPQGQVFKQAFGSFEPDKYDYRMGPNGVPQRKLKGK